MENMIQEAQAQQAASEHTARVPTEECLTCASGFDPSVGGNALFQAALFES